MHVFLIGIHRTGAYPGFKEGGVKCTGAKCPGKILGCHAHFWSREHACGRGQTQTRDRSRSNYNYRRTFASRNEGSGSAVLIIL